jgi:predicted ATPase/class 3 adenylate cyclase
MSSALLETARRLTAYIPLTLARHIAQEGLPEPGRPHYLNAATLFSDISGFTRMAEELASDGPRGAEELNRVLLLTFTAMIDVIHDAGGAVSHFHGDAMSVYFPDEDGQATQRALACAWMMQRLMAASLNRAVTSRPALKDPVFHLTMRIGVGYGRCLEMVVGDPAERLEFVLAGPAVDEAAAAQQKAAVGEVIASQAALRQAGLPAEAPFSPLTTAPAPPTGHALLHLDKLETAALERLVEATTPFLPPALGRRLQSVATHFVAEHRPVTSLFVQFEGINFEADNAGNLLQLYYQWASQVVKRYGGENSHLNRLLTGDKGNQLHIIFGAPIAPDSPDQAIRCALALQREKPAYITNQKIGLAVGKVFACPVGSESRREYTVVGDVVNLSARLTQVCSVGGVLVSEPTAARTDNQIEYDPLPAVQLKGKQEPTPIYRALGERRNIAQLQPQRERQRPLIGREKELELLLGGLELGLHGIGGAAALYGPIGVGKTRLLAAGVDYWLEAGGVVWVGVCQPHTADVPFGPWLDIWRDFFSLQAGITIEEQAHQVVEQCLKLWPEAGEDVGLWGEVLGLPIPLVARLDQLAADVRRARFFNLLRHCIQAAVTTRPALIILEDIHWADHATLELIDELSEWLSGLPLFIALTHRPVPDLALKLLNRPICTPIVMSDLPPPQARQLVQHLIGESELPLAVEQHLGLRDQEGHSSPVNPLFLEEALRVMLATGVLSVNGRLRVNEELLTRMQVPDTIHGLLLARLDHLPAASRDVLQVASVIGRQFGLDTLGGITPDRSRNLLVELLSDLSDAEMTQLIAYDPELTYLFQHAMTREVAYESLSYARRQSLHEAIADWLAERYADNLKPLYPVLAYHYSRTDIHEKGLEYSLAAAHDARRIFANKEAVELYRLAESHLLAMDEGENWEVAIEIYLARGHVALLLGDFISAEADFSKGLTFSRTHNDLVGASRAYNLIAELRYRQARYSQIESLTSNVINELAHVAPPLELIRAFQWAGMAASAMMEHEKALAWLKRAELLCRQTNNNDALASILNVVAFVYYLQEQLELALQAMQQGVELSRHFSIPVNIGVALNNIGLIQHKIGQPNEALQTLNEAAAILRDTSRNNLAHALGNRAVVLAYLGNFAESLADFEEAIDLLIRMDDERGLADYYLSWGFEYSSVLGEWDAAQIYFDRARDLIALQPESYAEEQVRLLIGVGQVKLQKGEVLAAELLFEQAASLSETKGMSWWQPVASYFGGLVKLAQNEKASGRNHFQKAYETIQSGRGCPDYLPLVLLELAYLETEKNSKLNLLKKCVEAAKDRARYLDRKTCLQTAGRILVECDDPSLRLLGRESLAFVS